jgi:hypothetical protein
MPQEIVIRELPEAAEIAEALIAEHHPHLEDASVLYLATSQKRKSRGQVVLGTAGKMAPPQRYLSSGVQQSVEAGADFLLIFTEAEWMRLTGEQRRAAVDHELCHCIQTTRETADGEIEYGWGLRGHDVECFAEEIERHGLWRRELRDLAAEMQQLPLDFSKATLATSTPAAEPVGAGAP